MIITNIDVELLRDGEKNFEYMDLSELFSEATLNKLKTIFHLDNPKKISKETGMEIIEMLSPEYYYWIKRSLVELDNLEIKKAYLKTEESLEGVFNFAKLFNEKYGFAIDDIIRYNGMYYVSFDQVKIPSPKGIHFSFIKLRHHYPESIIESDDRCLISFKAISLMFLEDMYSSLTETSIMNKAYLRTDLFTILQFNGKPTVENNLSTKKSLRTALRRKFKKTYIMHDSNTGFYKIGNSVNPRFREKTLQSEKPTVNLIGMCGVNIEKKLHDRYKSKRVRGEWFDLNISDVVEVKQIFSKFPGYFWL